MLQNGFLGGVLSALPNIKLNDLPKIDVSGNGMAAGMIPPTGGGDDKPVPITSDTMRRWNNLIDFAKQKGYAGMADLDHNPDLRSKVFAEYNKANPDNSISEDLVKPIQNEIQNYKSQALENIKKNPDSFPGKPEDFMKGISQVDGIFGQKTSSWKFPEAYMVDKDTNEKKKLGFANQVTFKQP